MSVRSSMQTKASGRRMKADSLLCTRDRLTKTNWQKSLRESLASPTPRVCQRSPTIKRWSACQDSGNATKFLDFITITRTTTQLMSLTAVNLSSGRQTSLWSLMIKTLNSSCSSRRKKTAIPSSLWDSQRIRNMPTSFVRLNWWSMISKAQASQWSRPSEDSQSTQNTQSRSTSQLTTRFLQSVCLRTKVIGTLKLPGLCCRVSATSNFMCWLLETSLSSRKTRMRTH